MPLQKNKVLVLNASYEPLSICDARSAVLLLFCGKAIIVASHPEYRIRTISNSYPLPVVVRLTVCVRIEYHHAVLSRRNLFRRDGYRCQYCGCRNEVLTVDHVLPKSRGGSESWENLTTACKPCNARKGNRTPEEAGMSLLRKPGTPSRITLMQQHFLSLQGSDEWKPWLYLS